MLSKHLAAEMGPRGIRVRPRQSSLPASDVSLPPAGPVVAPTVPATPPARMASRPAVPGRVPPVSAPPNAEEDVRYGLRVAAGYAWRPAHSGIAPRSGWCRAPGAGLRGGAAASGGRDGRGDAVRLAGLPRCTGKPFNFRNWVPLPPLTSTTDRGRNLALASIVVQDRSGTHLRSVCTIHMLSR